MHVDARIANVCVLFRTHNISILSNNLIASSEVDVLQDCSNIPKPIGQPSPGYHFIDDTRVEVYTVKAKTQSTMFIEKERAVV
jgi:hypothetical protein